MTKEFIEKDHEKMVRILKDYLQERGYKVETEKTIEYAGYRTDMEAKKEKEVLCIEVVNGDGIDNPQTRKKWEAISGNRDCDFCLFVKKEKEKEVKELLEKWAIYYRKIWTYNSKAV